MAVAGVLADTDPAFSSGLREQIADRLMTVAENAIAAFDAAHDDVLAGLFELAGIAATPPGRRIQV